MAVVLCVSKEPSLYWGEGRILAYRGDGNARIWNIGETIKGKGMEKVREALGRLFNKLTELSVGFTIRSIKVERDPEVENWKYGMVEVELHLPARLFHPLEDFLIRYVYSALDPEEATKLLLILRNV